jgi:hypothetical protein
MTMTEDSRTVTPNLVNLTARCTTLPLNYGNATYTTSLLFSSSPTTFPEKKKKNAQNQRKSNLRKEQEKHQNPRFWIPDPGDRHPASLGSIQGEPQTMVG